MASSSALRLLSCRSVARFAVARSTPVQGLCSAPRPALFSVARCIAISAPRLSIEQLPEKDQDEVRARALAVVKNFHRVDPDKVSDDAKFIEDLGLDSLDAVEIVMALEDEFEIEISDEEAEKIGSLRVALDTIAVKVAAK